MADQAHDPAIADLARLSEWLAAHGVPGAGRPRSARFASGGASNPIFELRRGDHRFALRRPPGELAERSRG